MPNIEFFEDIGHFEDGIHFQEWVLRRDYLRALIQGPDPDDDDIEVAQALIDMIHKALRAFSEGRAHGLDDDNDLRLALRAAHSLCNRLGVSFPKLDFRDFSSFRSDWISKGLRGDGSWDKRAKYLADLLSPLENELFARSLERDSHSLLSPVTPRSGTGWEEVDREVRELRQLFARARTPQDFGAVGYAATRIVEHLADYTYDPAKHSQSSETPIPRGDTKNRFDAVINCELRGPENEAMRRYARATVELAQLVKHRKNADRREAGVAADSVIALVNLMRRISVP